MIFTCDVHTHTTFCDGKNTPEEMVKAALDKGLATLGFSSHAPMDDIPDAGEWCMKNADQAAYFEKISRLKEQYAERLRILCGIERDILAPALAFPCDYVIGSVHTLCKNGTYFSVDNTPEELQNAVTALYGSDALLLARDYFERVAKVVDVTACDIVGHFDLLTKFNEKYPLFDTASKPYQSLALEALDAVIETGKIIEINTGALSRGWRTTPYPEPFLLKHLGEKNAPVMLTSDAHTADTLCHGFETAYTLATFCGIRNIIQW